MTERDDAWTRLLDEQERELDAMTEEQLTLHLARLGRSPEDVRRSLAKLEARLAELDERKAQGPAVTERESCPDCVPEAPNDFAGITGNACMKHSGWPGHCRCEFGYSTHNEGCPKVKNPNRKAQP